MDINIPHTEGLAWRSPMEVHWPRAHLSVTNRSSKGRPTSKEKNKCWEDEGKKNSLLFCSSGRHRLKLWIHGAERGELAGSLSSEVHRSLCQPWCRWYLLRSSSFLKTDGSTSQETPPRELRAGKTCCFSLRRRPSSELLHPCWPPRRTRMNTHKTTKRQKEKQRGGGTWDVNVTSFPPEAREEGGGGGRKKTWKISSPVSIHAALKWGNSPPRRPFFSQINVSCWGGS